MIVSRTPLRISFVGGGTDLPEFYAREDGQVLNTGINKYLYVTAKRQLDIVEYKYRIGWSKSEFRNKIEEIEHPIVRETFRLLNIDFPIEITTFADVPANTGLGSSSAFTVGLLHALHAILNRQVSKSQLASLAAHIELDILKRNIGKQDHYAAAYGNLNIYKFFAHGEVSVEPVFYSPETREKLESSLLLFYTAIKRDASEVLKTLSEQSGRGADFDALLKMRGFVPLLNREISSHCNIHEIGRILDESWNLKKSLSGDISSTVIDEHYTRARKAGALGGKLLGAGGGGFLLFVVEPEKRKQVREALSHLYQMPFKFDQGGSRITYYDPQPI